MPLRAGLAPHWRSLTELQVLVWYVPEAHACASGVQEEHETSPTDGWNCPLTQAVQEDAPTASVKRPASHSVQYVSDVWSAAPLPYLPVAHAVHSEFVVDGPALNLPCTHGRHVPSLWLPCPDLWKPAAHADEASHEVWPVLAWK